LTERSGIETKRTNDLNNLIIKNLKQGDDVVDLHNKSPIDMRTSIN